MNIHKILALPRSLVINLRLFGMAGIKIPILVANNVKCKGLRRGAIEIANPKPCSVILGFDGVQGIQAHKNGYLIIGKQGKILFKGTAFFASGISIRVERGLCSLGDKFSCNKNVFLSCSEGIDVGDDVLVGWDVSIRDSDGHRIIDNGQEKPSVKQVTIGNHVWIAAHADILKGVMIPNDCVVGYRSCVTKKFNETNCIIAGFPADIVRKNINWIQ